MITKRQQEAGRDLVYAQHEWLKTYGWQQANHCRRPERMRWRHALLTHQNDFAATEAVYETRVKPSIGREMLSKKQRWATDNLERAERAWLEAYGWQPADHGRWSHPRISSKFHMTTQHALLETTGKPQLGWP